MNAVELWGTVCERMHENMSEISYKTWIEDKVTPVELTDDRFVLEIEAGFVRSNLLTRYGTLLEESVYAALGRAVDVAVYTKREWAEQQAEAAVHTAPGALLQATDRIELSARYELFLMALADLLIGKGVLRPGDRSAWLRMQMERFLRDEQSDAITTICLPYAFVHGRTAGRAKGQI